MPPPQAETVDAPVYLAKRIRLRNLAAVGACGVPPCQRESRIGYWHHAAIFGALSVAQFRWRDKLSAEIDDNRNLARADR